jgi:hypothetical protein
MSNAYASRLVLPDRQFGQLGWAKLLRRSSSPKNNTSGAHCALEGAMSSNRIMGYDTAELLCILALNETHDTRPDHQPHHLNICPPNYNCNLSYLTHWATPHGEVQTNKGMARLITGPGAELGQQRSGFRSAQSL